MLVRNKGKWVVVACVLALLIFVGVGTTCISSTHAYAEETKVEISVVQSASQTTEINMIGSTETFTGETYIPHPEYFLANPRHAKNTTSDNPVGTCTTVAMQMVMGYHNYYTDRRLIPQKTEDGKEFLCKDYGDPETNPAIDMSHKSDNSGLGCAEIGTEDAFFYELFRLNRFADDTPFGQAIGFVAAGATDFVGMYASEIADSVTIASSFSPMEHAMEEIDAGRPIILGIQPLGNPADSFHVMVAYGYATLNGELGFIVHKGWYTADRQIWVPASQFWCDIRMSVGHEHTIIDTKENWPESKPDKPVTPTHRKIKCDVCGYHGVDPLYETNPVGDTITALRYPMAEVEIPSVLDNKKIITIGNSAFAESDIHKIKLTTNIVDIESNAFADCRQLTEITSFGNVRTIGMQAFKNCTALTNVTLPSTVVSVGVGAFTGCDNINLTVSSNNRNYSAQNNILYNKNKTELVQAYNRDIDLTILPSVRTIAPYAFLDNRFIETVRIDGVSDIGEQAFAGCVNLYAVFCKSVEPPTVGQDIFMGLTLDKNFAIYVPYRVQEVYKAAFGSYAEFVKSYPVEVQLISDGVIVERLNWYDGMIIEGLPQPSQTGKTFGGWYDSAGKAYQNGDILSCQDILLILTADWTANTYKVTLDPDGGEVSSEDIFVPYGSEFILPIPTKDGNVFEGWQDENEELITTENGEGFQAWNRAENTSLKAKWRVKSYKIRIEGNGYITWLGTDGLSDDECSIHYNDVIDLINLVPTFKKSTQGHKTGHIFDHFEYENETITWPTVPDLWADGTIVDITPCWVKEKYILYFNTQCEIEIAKIEVEYGAEINLPRPTRTGYIFCEWFDENNPFRYKYMPDLSGYEQTNGSRMLTADWALVTYTVIYHANGGAGTMASTIHYYNQEQALRKNTFTKRGHEFIGWATSDKGSVVYTDEKTVVNLTLVHGSTVELYAVWKACRYNIIYKNLMPDIEIYDTTYTYGYGLSQMPILYRYDKMTHAHDKVEPFYGWYTSNAFTTRVTSISATSIGDVTVYAKYEYRLGSRSLLGEHKVTDGKIENQPSLDIRILMSQYYDQVRAASLNKIKLNITINLWEVNDGYQLLKLYAGSSEAWSTQIEHGGSGVNKTAHTYTFTVELDVSKYSATDTLVLRLSADGFGLDTWKFDRLTVETYFAN